MDFKHIFGILIALSTFVSVGNIQAEEIRDYYSEPGLNPFKDDQKFLNESIDPFSGTLQHKHVDLKVPGNGGLDIVINRIYTSRQELTGLRNPVGVGWTLHFGRIVVPTAYYDRICSQQQYSVSTNDNPSIEFADGSRELLVVNNIDSAGELVTKSNWKAVCNSGSTGLLVTSPDGTVYTMDKESVVQEVVDGGTVSHYSWYTSRIQDLRGNYLDISYQLSAGEQLISSISASDGRTVQFNYQDAGTSNARLSSISANGQTITYLHDPVPDYAGHFFLKEVRKSTDYAWKYTYYPEVTQGPTTYGQFSMESVTYPYGGTVTYTYDGVQFDNTDNKSIYTTVVTGKTTAGVNVTSGTWAYEYLPPGSAGGFEKRVITTPTRREDHYYYGYNTVSPGDVWRIGLLSSKEIYTLSDTLIDAVGNTWDKRLVSNENWWHGRVKLDQETYAPILLSSENWRNSKSLTTTFSAHGIYGNPGQIIEEVSSIGEQDRETQITYYTDIVAGIIGLKEDETITGIGTIDRQYAADGLLQSVSEYGVQTSFTYHSTGDIHFKTNARGFQEEFLNYTRGIAQLEKSQVDPTKWITVSRSVNPTGTVASVTDGRLITTGFTYDTLNRLESINYPINADVTISYVLEGGYLRKRVLSRGNYQATDIYDGFGNIIEQTREDVASSDYVTVTTQFDALGRKTFASNPNAVLGTSYQFDELDRTTRIENSDGSFITQEYGTFLIEDLPGGGTTYHADTKVTDEEGHVSYTYTRLYGTHSDDGQVINVINDVNATQFKRNLLGNITEVTQGAYNFSTHRVENNLIRTYSYDSHQFLESVVYPETGTTTYGRDAVGNLTSKQVATSPITYYQYDGRDRLTDIDYPGGTPDVLMEYDGNDNLTYTENSNGSWSYVYDENDNLSQESLQLLDGSNLTLSFVYTYDGLDNRKTITYPNGLVVDNLPNALGRSTKVGGFVNSILYHPTGQISEINYTNGVRTTYDLNDRLFISRIATGTTAAELVDINYQYDGVGNVSSYTDANNGSNQKDFTYDNIGRVISISSPGGGYYYIYNTRGEIKQLNFAGDSMYLRYSQSTGRLEYANSFYSSSAVNINHDIYGNTGGIFNDASHLISKGNYDFFYDSNGLLLSETDSENKVKGYKLHTKSGQLLYELEMSGCRDSAYIYIGASLISKRDDDMVVDCASLTQIIDSDKDGMPDYWEFANELDAGVADNAQDKDGDLLSNYDEYLNGSSAILKDTDADGMSDYYEVSNGLDATTNDASLDADSDGAINIHEYFAGTDPNDYQSNPASRLIGYTPLPIGAVEGNSTYYFGTNATLDKNGNILGRGRFLTDGFNWLSPLSFRLINDEYTAVSTLTKILPFYGGSRDFIMADDDGAIYIGGFLSYAKINPIWGIDWNTDHSLPIGSQTVNYSMLGAIGNDILYDISIVNSDDSYVLSAFSKDTGQHMWDSNIGISSNPLDARPVVSLGDTVHVPKSTQNVNSIVTLDSSGNVLWETNVIGAPTTPALGFDGTLYISTVTLIYDALGEIVDRQPGRLYALDPNGTVLWSHSLTYVPQAVTIGIDNTLYVAGSDSSIKTYTTNGTFLWSYNSGNPGEFYQPIIGNNGVAYVIHGTQSVNDPDDQVIDVYAFDLTGNILWIESVSGQFDPANSTFNTPVLDQSGTLKFWAANIAYFDLQNSRLFSIKTDSDRIANSAWPGANGGNQRKGRLNECAEGDQDLDDIMDCADSTPLQSTAPIIDITGPSIGSYRKQVCQYTKANGETTPSQSFPKFVYDEAFDRDITFFAWDINCKNSIDLVAKYISPIYYSWDSIILTASGFDPGVGDIGSLIQWTSNVDGLLGTGASLSTSLSEGGHYITASVVDGEGKTGYDNIYVYIKSSKPSISLASISGNDVAEYEIFDTAYDVLDTQIMLHPSGSVDRKTGSGSDCSLSPSTYEDLIYSIMIGNRCTDHLQLSSNTSIGSHQITQKTMDLLWETAETTFNINVVGPPTTTNLSALNNTTHPPGTVLSVTSGVYYPGGVMPDLYNVRWYSDQQGLVGEGQSTTISLDYSRTGHMIWAEVTDSAGYYSVTDAEYVFIEKAKGGGKNK